MCVCAYVSEREECVRERVCVYEREREKVTNYMSNWTAFSQPDVLTVRYM